MLAFLYLDLLTVFGQAYPSIAIILPVLCINENANHLEHERMYRQIPLVSCATSTRVMGDKSKVLNGTGKVMLIRVHSIGTQPCFQFCPGCL